MASMPPGEKMSEANHSAGKGPLIYRQSVWTRVTHWIWAICLFFLLLTGLQIFNAHPALYIGQQSGFEFENSVLEIGAINTDAGPRGRTTIFGNSFDSTALGLGMSGNAERPTFTAFPGSVTIPSYRDLGTGRVVHFFFGWIFVATIFIWFVASFINGHIRRDIVPKPADIAGVPRDVVDHATLRFKHGRSYGPLQKLAYFGVFHPVPADRGHGPHHESGHEFDRAVDARPVRRAADGADHPLHHHGPASWFFHHPHHHGAGRRAVQRTALDDHGLVSCQPRYADR